jgi:hypothetical protein
MKTHLAFSAHGRWYEFLQPPSPHPSVAPRCPQISQVVRIPRTRESKAPTNLLNSFLITSYEYIMQATYSSSVEQDIQQLQRETRRCSYVLRMNSHGPSCRPQGSAVAPRKSHRPDHGNTHTHAALQLKYSEPAETYPATPTGPLQRHCTVLPAIDGDMLERCLQHTRVRADRRANNGVKSFGVSLCSRISICSAILVLE